MLLLSWNVAGWNTTVNRICEHYSNNTTDNNKNNNGNPTATKQQQQQQPSSSSSPIAAYFARHGNPMIICLQEHKIPYSQLTSRSEPRQAATVPGYESFWSCCVDPQRKQYAIYIYELGFEHRYVNSIGTLRSGSRIWLRVASVSPRNDQLLWTRFN